MRFNYDAYEKVYPRKKKTDQNIDSAVDGYKPTAKDKGKDPNDKEEVAENKAPDPEEKKAEPEKAQPDPSQEDISQKPKEKEGD